MGKSPRRDQGAISDCIAAAFNRLSLLKNGDQGRDPVSGREAY